MQHHPDSTTRKDRARLRSREHFRGDNTGWGQCYLHRSDQSGHGLQTRIESAEIIQPAVRSAGNSQNEEFGVENKLFFGFFPLSLL